MNLLGKYITVAEDDGGGLSGVVVKQEKGTWDGKEGFWITVDYGFGYFITEDTNVVIHPLIGEPQHNIRTVTYGGRGIYTLSEDLISLLGVKTPEPGVFLNVDSATAVTKTSQELSVPQVIALREILDQFLGDVQRIHGQDFINQARKEALG